MKDIQHYINEALKLGKKYRVIYFPESKEELIEIIKEIIKKDGNEANLNIIEVSKIDDFGYLFSADKEGYGLQEFNGDISKWNVSNVKNFNSMFFGSKFDGDLSKWDVSNAENMQGMFADCEFTGDKGSIENWDVSNAENLSFMFNYSKLKHNVNKWNPKSVKTVQMMFANCYDIKDLNLSNWKLSPSCDMYDIFKRNPIEQDYEKYPQKQ